MEILVAWVMGHGDGKIVVRRAMMHAYTMDLLRLADARVR